MQTDPPLTRRERHVLRILSAASVAANQAESEDRDGWAALEKAREGIRKAIDLLSGGRL